MSQTVPATPDATDSPTPGAPADPFGRLSDVRGTPPHRGARPVRRRAPAGRLGADAGPREEEVAVGPVGGRPRRGPSGPAADPKRPRRVVTRVGSGRLAAVHLRPPGPEARRRTGDPKPALWSLPAAGGEARLVLTARPAGSGRFAVAADSGDVVVAADTLPGGSDAEADEERRKKRKDAGVSAVLHEAYPVRYWDHDLGPAAPHLFWAGQAPGRGRARRTPAPVAARPHPGRRRRRAAPVRISRCPPTAGLLVRTEDVPDGPAGRRHRGRAHRHGHRRDPAPGRRPPGRRLRRPLLPRRHAPSSASASR